MFNICNYLIYFVADPEGDINCNIVSTNLPTVTAAGGVIAYGTQNVILYCICNKNNVAAGRAKWFLNGTRIFLARDDGSGSPYVRDILPSTLTIPSFVAPHNGIYSCGPTNRFNDVSSRGDEITLALPGTYACIFCLKKGLCGGIFHV